VTDPLLGAMRSHACGALRAADAGTEVRLAGWVARRRDHGGVVFLDLRDASGVVHPQQAPAAAVAAHGIRAEDCVRLTGTVAARPPGNENPDLPTGAVELAAGDLEVLAPSATPPFPLEGRVDADETLRLQYRYLDLRRPATRRALEVRARANAVLRRVLEERGFLEVETPYLTKSTPEGARDFLVTTHLAPGQFYALPQSPQLFKQLLMVAGIERYYQIVRCFRDEALRADRQPEFTQLDLELSFLDEEDVYDLGEQLVAAVWREVLGVELPVPFPRLTYAEAMRRFGTDKPDLRYGMELHDLGPVFAGTASGCSSARWRTAARCSARSSTAAPSSPAGSSMPSPTRPRHAVPRAWRGWRSNPTGCARRWTGSSPTPSATGCVASPAPAQGTCC
jgi:aspartyl-tRNA synthetase